MMKKLPSLKYRLALLMLINPLFAMKALAGGHEIIDVVSHGFEYGFDLVKEAWNSCRLLFGPLRTVGA